jgi:hypothetical protein
MLAPPDPALWRARSDWFWRAHDFNAGPQALELDAHNSLLLAEVEIVFCAGAWAAVVILTWTLVEAEQRMAMQRRAARGEEPRPEPDIDWLREQRNALVHIGDEDVPGEQALETMAQGAIRVMFKTLFAEAWR